MVAMAPAKTYPRKYPGSFIVRADAVGVFCGYASGAWQVEACCSRGSIAFRHSRAPEWGGCNICNSFELTAEAGFE
jgi:hypothetical protein